MPCTLTPGTQPGKPALRNLHLSSKTHESIPSEEGSWVLTLDPGKQEGLRGLVATPGRGGLVSGGLLAQYHPRVPRSPLLTPALPRASLALRAQLCWQLLLSLAQCVPPREVASLLFLAGILSSAAATALASPPQTHSFFKTSILFLPTRAVLWSPPPGSAAGQAQIFSSPGPALAPGAGSASSFRWGQLHLFLDLRGQTSPRVRCSACSRGSINEGWHHCKPP